MSVDQKRTEMLETNRQQTEFYEKKRGTRGNVFTKVWRQGRIAQRIVREQTGVDEAVWELHRDWLGDLSRKRVLDLGCHTGNYLSVEIAGKSADYLGVDLSRPAIAELGRKLEAAGLTHARARAVDFLSPEFDEPPFDVVYAYSVAHHFRHMDVFLQRLQDTLAPGGYVVTFDPLQTSRPIRLMRAAYRPFQSDKDWEWPFDRGTFETIDRYFEIDRLQGVMGKAKWAVPLALVSRDRGLEKGSKWHAHDQANATTLGPDLWSCLQVAMRWRKRST